MSSLAVRRNYDPIIVDVREPAEYKDLHLYGAVNIPSTSFTVSDYAAYQHRPIYLVCNTGRRVLEVKQKLEEAGFDNVHVNDVQMQVYSEGIADNPGIEGTWTVDRQFRLTLGTMLLISTGGAFLDSALLLTIAGLLATALTVTAIIDRCYLKMLIAKMPWNLR